MTDVRSTLHVGAIMIVPYVNECYAQERCPERGLCVDISLFMCELLRVQCKFDLRADNNHGERLENGTWIGAIGDVANGLVDTYVPFFTPTTERLQAVQFSPVFLEDSVVLLTRMPEASHALSSNILKMFSVGAWCMFAVSLTMIWLLSLASRRLNNNHGGKRRNNRTGFYRPGARSGFLYVDEVTNSERLNSAMQWLISLIVVSTISGVTIGHQLAGDDQLPFVDVESFVGCLDSGRCALAGLTTSTSFLQSLLSPDSPLKEKLDRALSKRPLMFLPYQEVVKTMMERKDVFVTTLSSNFRAEFIRWRYRGDQQFHVVPTDLPSSGSFPFRFDERLIDRFEKGAKDFVEMGFAKRLYRKYGEGRADVSDRARRKRMERPRIIRLSLVVDAFVTLAIGWTVAFAGFVAEVIFSCSFR